MTEGWRHYGGSAMAGVLWALFLFDNAVMGWEYALPFFASTEWDMMEAEAREG